MHPTSWRPSGKRPGEDVASLARPRALTPAARADIRDFRVRSSGTSIKGLDGDDRTEAAPLPSPYRGAWDGEPAAQRRRAGTHHMLAQTMIVRRQARRFRRNDGHHAARITLGGSDHALPRSFGRTERDRRLEVNATKSSPSGKMLPRSARSLTRGAA